MDYPRFERIEGRAEDLHERYHGGRLVTLIFAIVDGWQKVGRRRELPMRAMVKTAVDTTAGALQRCLRRCRSPAIRD